LSNARRDDPIATIWKPKDFSPFLGLSTYTKIVLIGKEAKVNSSFFPFILLFLIPSSPFGNTTEKRKEREKTSKELEQREDGREMGLHTRKQTKSGSEGQDRVTKR